MDADNIPGSNMPDYRNQRGGGKGRFQMVRAAQIAPAYGLRDSRGPHHLIKSTTVLSAQKDNWTQPKTIHQNGTSSSWRPCSAGSGVRSR